MPNLPILPKFLSILISAAALFISSQAMAIDYYKTLEVKSYTSKQQALETAKKLKAQIEASKNWEANNEARLHCKDEMFPRFKAQRVRIREVYDAADLSKARYELYFSIKISCPNVESKK